MYASRLLFFTASMAIARLCTAQADLCAGAPALACGAVVAGNTTAFTADVAPFCGTGDGTGGGVWYRFVGTGGSVTASLCGSGYDTKIRVYTGTCAAMVCAVGNDDFCGLQSQVTWASALGTTYYILVHGFGAAVGAYTLTITCPPPPVPMCYSQTAIPYVADPYTGTAVALTDDVHSGVVNIGFSFCFNGTSYTQCVIASNNYITFNLANANAYSPWVTVAVPNATPAQPHNAVLDPWQDINPGVGGSIRYQTLGTAPNRRFVVSYLNVPMFSCTSQLYSSQIVLYEGSNCIGSFILNKPICTTWNNGNAVHGLQNNGGTSATVVAGRNNTQWTAASLGRLFTPTCAPCSTATTAQCLSVALPIELLHFHGRRAGDVNLLEWATATEQESERFTLERSTDGIHFTALITLDAAGTSNAQIDYAAKDPLPLPGTNYYRLRSTDVDGDESLSEVIAIATLRPHEVIAYPNPASDVLLVQGAHVVNGARYSVLSIAGKELASGTLRDGRIDISALTSGVYLLQVDTDGSTGRQRFVKQ